MATCKRELKLPWLEAGPPNRHDDKVDSDQWVVNKELSLSGVCTDAGESGDKRSLLALGRTRTQICPRKVVLKRALVLFYNVKGCARTEWCRCARGCGRKWRHTHSTSQ